jgi:hypothetical protein
MWVNKHLFQVILDDNKHMTERVEHAERVMGEMFGGQHALQEQKAKDDVTIDWMRHRINALEKERSILLMRAAGIALPVPEIVPTMPRSTAPGFDALPSFEDVGDGEAARLGLANDEATGELIHTK